MNAVALLIVNVNNLWEDYLFTDDQFTSKKFGGQKDSTHTKAYRRHLGVFRGQFMRSIL